MSDKMSATASFVVKSNRYGGLAVGACLSADKRCDKSVTFGICNVFCDDADTRSHRPTLVVLKLMKTSRLMTKKLVEIKAVALLWQ